MHYFKKLFILSSLVVLCNLFVYGQFEGNNLLYSNTILDFNCGNVEVINKQTFSSGFTSSISDSNGNLLFYADQTSVYNKNQQLMTGGINPFSKVNYGFVKSVLIVPQPGNNNRYNVFYFQGRKGTTDDTLNFNRILIDMSLNSGLGEIILQDTNKVFFQGYSLLSAAMHQNKRDFWIITVKNDSIYSFLLNSSSFSDTPVVSCLPMFFSSKRMDVVGYHIMSYDQKQLAIYYSNKPYFPIGIYNFDNNTGKFTSMKYFLTVPSTVNSYGFMSFSPNGKYLYFANGSAGGGFLPTNIYQYDISLNTATDILVSAINIGNTTANNWGQMIIAPDNKIYVTRWGHYFGVINSPNKKGLNSNYKDSGLYNPVGFLSTWSPNFITRKPYLSRFNFSSACINQPTYFSLAIDKDSSLFYWDFGDSSSGGFNSSTTDEPSHIYKNYGRYKVRLVTNRNGYIDTSFKYICIGGPLHRLPTDTTLCAKDSLSLNAGNDGFDYLWSTGDTTKIITIKDTGIYTLTISYKNCQIIDTITVHSGSTFDPIFNYNDTFICSGDYIKIDTKLKGYKFSWSTGDTASYIISKDSGMYVVNAQRGNCIISDTVFIAMKNKPKVNLGNDTTICSGDNILIDAHNNGAKYQWSTGETSQSIFIHNKGIYSVVITKDSCLGYDSININEFPLPFVSLGNDTVICEADTQTILLYAASAASYQWLPGNENTANILVTKPGIYSVIIIDSNGCKNSDSINIFDNCITQVFIPNAFSPNNDGINDIFLVAGKNFISFEMKIFDRWGKNIFNSNVPDKGWDGTFHNVPYPQGVYLYIIKFSTKEIQKKLSGTVTLIR